MNTQSAGNTQSANPTPRVDIVPQEHWSETERSNVSLVGEFVQLIMNDHNFDSVRRRFAHGAYQQHSRGIPDELEGLLGYLRQLTERFPEYSYDVKHAQADGEYVTFHSHATLRSKHRGDQRKGFNIIDRWRIVDGEIREHWDAIQPLDFSARLLALLVGGRVENTNGLF